MLIVFIAHFKQMDKKQVIIVADLNLLFIISSLLYCTSLDRLISVLQLSRRAARHFSSILYYRFNINKIDLLDKIDLFGLLLEAAFLLPSPRVANAAIVEPVINAITANFLLSSFNNME